MNFFTNSCTTLVGGIENFNARSLNALKAFFLCFMFLMLGGGFAIAQSDSTLSASTDSVYRDSDHDDDHDDDDDDNDGDDNDDDDDDDDDDDNDVAICHQLDNGGSITIYVNPSAVEAHLDHGDYLGVCDDGGNSEQPCVLALNVLCPQDVTVECGQEGNFDVTGTPGISGEFCLEELHVNFEDVIISCNPCGKVISRTWIVTLGNIVEVCTQIITSQDTQGPEILGLESEINVQCLEGIPGFQEVGVVDACSGDGSIQNWSSQTGAVQSECVASTAFGPGADWAVWLPTLSSASGANFVFNAEGGHFDQFADGTAHMHGTVVNTVNASEEFIVDLWFENKADWATWSGQGRNYKNDLLLACATDNHQSWNYYELVGGFSTLTGAGDLAGTELYIYHMPASFYFGFQIGVGANNKNCENGMSGWFTYEGFMGAQAISGHGDVNVDLQCEDINLNDCIHNTSFTYFYRGVDGCGHASIASQQINVNDTTAPVFSNCPESFTMECSDPAAPVAEGIEAIDNCSGDVVIAYLGEVAEGNACLTTLTRTWSATDICGNRAECVQVITIVDTTAPVLSNLPEGEITVECDAVPAAAEVSITDNCDQNPTLVYNEERIDGNCPGNYTLVRSWYGYDQCQNSTATYTQTIHVQDTTAPTFDAYEFYAHIECDQIPAMITAQDNCGQATVVVVQETLNSGGCLGVLYRLYRATDECGNSSEAEQFISIMDTTAPEFVGLPADMTVECSHSVMNNDGGVTGTDNCGHDVVVTYSEQYVGQDDACPETYDIIRTWVATDYCENEATATRTTHVEDTTAPEFVTFPADMTISCDDEIPAVEYPTVTDNCDYNVDVVLGQDMMPGSCPQNYTIYRTFRAYDNCMNERVETQTITVVDETAPVFNEQNSAYTYECNTQIPVIQPIAQDNCGIVSYDYVEAMPFIEGPACNYTIQRVWTATDECGNASEFTQQITIVDTTAPVISGAAQLDRPCDDYAGIYVNVSDNCNEYSVDYTDEMVSGSCAGNVIRHYIATDACGNASAEFVQVIRLSDEVAPVIAFVSPDMVVECGDEYGVQPASFTDNCDQELDITSGFSSSTDGCTTTEIYTWTATDHCYNVTTATTVVTIVDTTDPYFTSLPENATVNCDETIPGYGNYAAADNCDSEVEVSVEESMIAGNCPQSYTIQRTYRAYDNCGNQVVETRYVYVVDIEAPVFGENVSEYTYECGTVELITPNATDNCGSIEFTYSDVPVELTNDSTCGQYLTYSHGGWGNPNNPQGQYATANFAAAFPNGLTVGCNGNVYHFTSAAAVQAFLPAGGNSFVLSGNTDNPTGIQNQLASQLVALIFSVTFDANDAAFAAPAGNLGDLMFASGSFEGMTLNEVIAIANQHLGGCASDYDLQAIASALESANTNYDGENVDNGVLTCGFEVNICTERYQRTWVATDECGNSSSFVQVITIVDTTAPVITGSSEIELPCDDYAGIYVTITDNCHEFTVDYTDLTVSGACAGNIIRRYTAIDECGNASTAFTQIIRLTDVVAPVIAFVSPDMVVECGDEYGVQPASFTDNCDQELDITSGFSSSTDGCTTTEIYTWTATDHCYNVTTATTVVTIVDTTDPYFTSLPENATVNCDETIPGYGNYAAADNCDSEVEVSVEESMIAGNCPQSYTIQRTYRAYDNCGNQVVETRYVYVVDTEAPVFGEQNSSYTYECNTQIPVIQPIAQDNCGIVSYDYVEAMPFIEGPACSYTIQRVWIATDECGNASEFTQQITIVDTQAPVVNTYALEIEMPCDSVSNEIMISAEDCNEVIITFSDEYVSGTCAGRIIRTYSVSDACGNVTGGLTQQIINLTDVTAPVVEVAPADVTIECGMELPTYSPVWSDNCADELQYAASSSISADNCTTVISQSWSAVDPCGNSTTVSRTISIVDSTAPVFTYVPSNEERDCNADDVVATAYADDNCSDVTISHNDVIVPGLCPASYTIERTYTATDVCGNYATYTQVINVSDNNGPVWGENQTSFVYECGSEAGVVTPVASDDCSEFTMSYVNGSSFELGCTSAFQRTWLALDACGNVSSQFVQYITFEDTTEPVLSGCPSDLVLACEDSIPAAAGVTAIDGCDSDVQVYYNEVILGDAPAEGSIADCNLITPARAAGNPCGYPYDWAMAMFNMPTAHRWYEVVDGSLVQYPGGSMHLVAQLENVLTPGTGWNVDVWFNGGMDWAAWSTQGFPTSFKADCGGVDDNFASWTYFLLQAGEGAELTGYGNYAGSVVNLVHAPSNNYFGFQLGDGANNYNAADNAFGGWFSYSGSFRANAEQNFSSVSGAGDFAFELDCCPDYEIVRQWTAVDCSGNTSTCTQHISFSSNVESNDDNDGQSTINTEAVSNERTSTIAVAPNPANSNAMFTFKAAHTAKTSIEVFDLTGKKVADVFMGTVEAGASYNVNYNVSDLATGLYTYRLTNGSDVKIDRLIINK